MRWIGLLIGLGLFTGVTGFAFLASAKGWGLPGALDKPVSIRQQSVTRRRHGGPVFLYFGSHRRHHGGGYRFGK
jgi:hypothetical protein